MIRKLWRILRCRSKVCPGYVVTGHRDGILMVGWRCSDCGQVKYYGKASA